LCGMLQGASSRGHKQREGEGAIVRQRHLIAVVVTFLIAVLVFGCGAGGTGNNDGRGGNRGAVATKEETSAPQVARSASKTKQEPAGLDVEVVSPDHAYQPVGFGEGSLWVADIATCNDTGSASASAGSPVSSVDGSVVVSLASCALPENMLLKRLDPRSGEEEAVSKLKGFSANTVEGTFGAGSLWVCKGDWEAAADVVLRVDPETNRVVDRISVESPTGLAFGHGSVWATSSGHGTVSRIDPKTGEVAAEIEVGRGAVDIATDERTGDVWVAGLLLKYGADIHPEDSKDNKLSRIDPATNRVVAEIPIAANSREGGAQSVAVGEGAVWAQSADGRLFKVDPATNKVVGDVPLGEYSSDLEVYGGAVWATVQASSGTRLVRVDPSTVHVVASEHGREPANGGYGPLAAGGGYVWLTSGGGLARVARGL
jgi:streptogramin lyase